MYYLITLYVIENGTEVVASRKIAKNEEQLLEQKERWDFGTVTLTRRVDVEVIDEVV